MWLIVGLGNPGAKYTMTRHNIGFLSVDLYAQSLKAPPWQEEHKALTSKFKIDGTPILLAKPMSFMNKSGEPLQALMSYYKIERDQILIIQDDIDQVFGKMRFHKNRGHGGHNGIRSISECLGTQDYTRLKLGVGRSPHPEMEVADWVLSKFSAEDAEKLPDFLNTSGDAIESLVFEGLSLASTKFNS